MKKFFLCVLSLVISFAVISQNQSYKGKSFSDIKPTKRTIKSNYKSGSTTIYETGFEFESSYNWSGWIQYDKDSDGHSWMNSSVISHSGEKSMVSESQIYQVGAVTPNNWLVSPLITIPALSASSDSSIVLSYWVGAQDLTWYQEKYKVLISSNGNCDYPDFTDTIYSEELPYGNWRQVKINISSYAGQNIYVAFIHSDVTDVYRLNIDDFAIYKTNDIDCKILSISAPTHGNYSSCTLGDNETIKANIYNNGGKSISNFNISYSINGGDTISENISSTIQPFDTLEYSFIQTADLSEMGSYSITVFTNIDNDVNSDNNKSTYRIDNSDGMIEIKALTDVYGDNEGLSYWSVVNNLSNDTIACRKNTWQWEIEISEKICIFNDSCYDITVADPNGMVDGSAYLQIFHDNVLIAGSDTPDSFTETIIENNVGTGCPETEVEITSINQTVSRCGLTETPVIVTIRNNGLNSISNIPVQFTVDAQNAVTDTISTTILPTATYTHTFSSAANISESGIHNIVASIIINDNNPNNNSISTEVDNITPIVIGSTPYTINFETRENIYGLDSIDANNDHPFDWDISNDGTNYFAMYYYNPSQSADDWLVMRCMEFEEGEHNIFFDIKAEQWPGYTTSEKMEVKFGSGPNPEDMTNTIIDMPNITYPDFTTISRNFTIPAAGVYFIGFHCYSSADQMALWLDNINISKGTSIGENSKKNIIIYPNPSTGIVYIENIENQKVEIINIFGETIINIEKANAKQILDLSGFANGMYFIRTENKTYKINLIK